MPMTIQELNERNALIESLKEILFAIQPVSNVAYNLGQANEFWDSSIYPSIQVLDSVKNKAYTLLKSIQDGEIK